MKDTCLAEDDVLLHDDESVSYTLMTTDDDFGALDALVGCASNDDEDDDGDEWQGYHFWKACYYKSGN